MHLKQLPNLISLCRLAVLPPLMIGAMAVGERAWFFGLLCVAWATDALDGFLARRLNAVTDLGRLLDSWADYVTLALCLAGLAWLWPEVMAREWRWIAAGVTACFAVVICGLVRYGRPPGYHTRLAKLTAIALPLAFASLLAGWSARPLHGVVVLQVLSTLEELAIFLLLPGHSGEVSSVRSAWRQRQTRLPAPPSQPPAGHPARPPAPFPSHPSTP
ncbi:hypothetical protein ESB00_18615 [Oleiharenicola lentus]|uniref:CDP-alcohol phosphatidyltransferase family protein n=1 Tax=Oleiharenicola lentus TaxID=2508720 RepID=A0A4Q1C5I5_9BACT|nr:CDP-alcohol phosphatidyltransferase family protein [Oleiharenicola lentus]RXK53700.1 hypothetical protein ESB00_18615 [Oleiharenicola lentus]